MPAPIVNPTLEQLNNLGGGFPPSSAFELGTYLNSIVALSGGMETLTYANPLNLDFDFLVTPGSTPTKTVSLAGDITFTFSNLAAGQALSLRIVADGAIRTLAFPAGVIFLGAVAPVSIAAGKTAVVAFTAYGPAATDVVAAYSVEP